VHPEKPTVIPASVSPADHPPSTARKRKQPSSPLPNSSKYKQDRLGKIVTRSELSFRSSSSWSCYIRSTQKQQPRLSRHVRHLQHRAASYLDSLRRHGAPVKLAGDPLSPAELDQRIHRGPHKSAHDYSDFVRNEIATFCDSGFMTVLPYDAVKHLPNLHLSPLGVVPQRDRRPRLIVDLTFWGVNDLTVSYAPNESMQFGRTLERLLYQIRHADPRYGPVYMCKLDISDGFYRIPLNIMDAPALAVLLPQLPGEPPLVAIPLAPPMGWVKSPPIFCAATETIADVANARMGTSYSTPHHLEALADTPTPSSRYTPTTPPTVPEVAMAVPSLDTATSASIPVTEPIVSSLPEPPTSVTTSPLPGPLSYIDVYMDDFMGLVQGNRRRRRVVRRILMKAIEEVFQPPATATPFEKEPISVKKMKDGDASWETIKTVLGWLIDSVRQTIRLPPHRVQRLQDIFDELRSARRVSLTRWRQVLGELRSMVIAIPGGRGLFSILQTGFQYADKRRVRLDSHIHAHLDDFEALVLDLAARPTRLAELISDALAAIGSVDASGLGMGGVWFTVDGPPLVWRERFPDDIVHRLVSSTNPTGDLTNSDFELAGVVCHQDILAQHFDVREASVSVLNDNTPAISRSVRGSITSRDPAAYLLRISSLHRRHHRYNADFQHIRGPANAMADDCSRLWQLSDAAFLAYFNQTYPQDQPWHLCHLQSGMRSAMISALHRKRVDPRSFLNVPVHGTAPGISGKTFAWSTPLTHSSIPSKTQFTTSWSTPSAAATVDLPKMASPSDLGQWRMKYAPSVRRWPVWGPKTTA